VWKTAVAVSGLMVGPHSGNPDACGELVVDDTVEAATIHASIIFRDSIDKADQLPTQALLAYPFELDAHVAVGIANI
jgi:hypothetical protein